MSDKDISPEQETEAKRRRASFWVMNGVGALFFYAFGYPAAIAMLFKALTEEQADRISEAWFTVPLVMLAAPLTWVADRFPLYQDYLEWLFETAGLV